MIFAAIVALFNPVAANAAKKSAVKHFLSRNSESCAANNNLSNSFVVFDEKSMVILADHDYSKKIYPASLVKLMTLYLAFEAIKHKKISMTQVITISQRAEEVSFVNRVNSLRLMEGKKISVQDAIEAVIVKSFNEAAVALAEAVAGNEWNFVRMMNKKALALTMTQSSFRNSSGLHEEGQYSTAADLAKLAFAIKKDFPEFYHFFSLKKFSYRGQKFESHNEILKEFKGAEGMKTGYTKASGFNLISSAKRNNNRIFAVLIGCESASRRNNLMTFLLELGFYKLHNGLENKADLNKIGRIEFQNYYKSSALEVEGEKILF